MTLEKRPDFPLVAAAITAFMRQMAVYVAQFATDSALATE